MEWIHQKIPQMKTNAISFNNFAFGLFQEETSFLVLSFCDAKKFGLRGCCVIPDLEFEN